MVNTQPNPIYDKIGDLFHNVDTEVVWNKAIDIVRLISPDYDASHVRSLYDDVLRIFEGKYPGYHAIETMYHDLPHTLDVFLCSVRLMHGMHVEGTRFEDDDISMVIIATLLHDVGYALQIDEVGGTGAKFTKFHVSRGIAFMQDYLAKHNFPPAYAKFLMHIMRSTDMHLPFENIEFPNQRSQLLGQIVGTADIVGQMADRSYLEKLQYLYLEFKEANMGDYRSAYDLLCKTKSFYDFIREKMDSSYDSLYTRLSYYFLDTMGEEKNFYLESIEKNIDYLSKVTQLNEDQYHLLLKRDGKEEDHMPWKKNHKSSNNDESAE